MQSYHRAMDPKLLELLVCPVTKGPLLLLPRASGIGVAQRPLAYPVRDGIPVLLENEARTLSDDELEQCPNARRWSDGHHAHVLIPARMASSRLPNKPLARHWGPADGGACGATRFARPKPRASWWPPTIQPLWLPARPTA
jgi:uncharacterized protein YbaR (Trm112 family)